MFNWQTHLPTQTTIKTLIIGAVGSGVALALNLPLAWVLGAMWATVVAAMVGFTPDIPRRWRQAGLATIGCYMGFVIAPGIEKFTVDTALIVVAATVTTSIITILVVSLLLRRLLRQDTNTILLSAMPGGLSLIFSLAGDYRANRHIIGMVSVCRILAVVTIIPLLAQFEGGKIVAVAPTEISLAASALFLFAFMAGMIAGIRTNSTQLCLLLPLFLAGALYIVGDINGNPPSALLYVAQMILGASIGARFNFSNWRSSAHITMVGCAAAAINILLAVGIALLLAKLTDVPFLTALLAVAPGGIAEICLLAQVMDVQPELVFVAQIGRLLFLVLTMPLVMHWANKNSSKTPPTNPPPLA